MGGFQLIRRTFLGVQRSEEPEPAAEEEDSNAGFQYPARDTSAQGRQQSLCLELEFELR